MNDQDREEVRRTVAQLNRTWIERRFDDLNGFFDEDIVMRGPGLQELARGRSALVGSYREFMGQSRIDGYEESNLDVDCWGDVAAARYDWAMTYEQKGAVSTESGQDMFVFVRRNGRWQALLRVMLF